MLQKIMMMISLTFSAQFRSAILSSMMSGRGGYVSRFGTRSCTIASDAVASTKFANMNKNAANNIQPFLTILYLIQTLFSIKK